MNLSSIVNGIYASIAQSDNSADSVYEIDSLEEFKKLGDFLNGNASVGLNNDYNYEKLNNSEQIAKSVGECWSDSKNINNIVLDKETFIKMFFQAATNKM